MILVKFTVKNYNPIVLDAAVLPRLGEILKFEPDVNYAGSYKVIRIEHIFESQGNRYIIIVEPEGEDSNKRSTLLHKPCDGCGRILTTKFYCPVCDNDE